MSITFKTKDGSSTVTVEADEVLEFSASILGKLILPSDEAAYLEATHIWNEMFMPNSNSGLAKKPAAVVKPKGVSDCTKIMKFVSKHSVLMSILAGGHNVTGSALCDGGLVINMRDMCSTIVDPVNETAITQGGTILRDFYEECYAYRLGTVGGVVSDTGVAGLTIGGGLGYLRIKHGMAVDNVISMTVVTADGDIKVCNNETNSDLFYALRGGGGGFGLVTSFEFRLHPIPDEHWAVAMAWDIEKLPLILEQLQRLIDAGEEDMALQIAAWPSCSMPHPEMQGKDKVLVAGGYTGDGDPKVAHSRLKEAMANACGGVEPLDLSHFATFPEWNRAFDGVFPMGTDRSYWKGHYCPKLTAQLGQDVLEVVKTKPVEGDKCFVAFWATYGKMLNPKDKNVAFTKRHAGAIVSFDSTWTDKTKEGMEKVIAYTRAGAAAIEKHSDGAYLQWAGDEEERKIAATKQYDDMDKLIAVKKKYDPQNVIPSWIKV